MAQVEDHLRDLGAEARKAHPGKCHFPLSFHIYGSNQPISTPLCLDHTSPGVKEASERAIINLRSLQTQYVAAVRRSSGNAQKHPTTALFQSQDVLRPFLLAANYSDADYELLVIALDSMQLLLRGDAVCSEDGAQISRVLVIQAWGCAGTLGLLTNSGSGGSGDGGSGNGAGSSITAGMIHGITGMMMLGSHQHQAAKNKNEVTTTSSARHPSSHRSMKEDQSIALKILQTISMMVDSNSMKLTQDVLGSCILACLILGAGEKMTQQSHSSMISSSNNVLAAKDRSGGAVGVAAGIVRRSSFATLNQILSNLFEKVNDVIVGGKDDNLDTSDMLLVAERSISDLCAIVDNHSSRNLQPNSLSGPFSAAAKEGLTPSPTTSLTLLDMVFKRGRVGVFQSIQSKTDNGDANEDQISTFHQRLMSQACELVISIFKMQHSHVYGPKISSDTHATDSSSDAVDFCFFYFAVTISSSVLLQQLPSVQSEKSATSMNIMCLEIVKLLVSFVTGATNAYHDSSDFEDGYIFSQTERDAFHIEQADANSRGGSAPSSRGMTSSRLAQENAEPHISGSIIPSNQMWRAFLSLDVLNRLVSSCLEEVHLLYSINGQADSEGSSTITLIAGAASDFATISASNREGILHAVMSAHNDEMNANNALDVMESSSSERLSIDGQGNWNAAAALVDKVTDASSVGSSDIPNCDAGETSWMAFKCILSMAKSLKLISSEDANVEDTIIAEILSGSFVSTITLLQHYIKRMCGSHVIVSRALTAYEELAYASMMMEDKPGNLRRQAILTSLCKLCLPKWGKKRPNCQLKESNIDALWTMLWLVHSHFEKILDEWGVIISTFDQLGSVSISSLKLSQAYAEKAAAIAKCFIRLPKFTTCFSKDALFQFTSSLVKLSDAVSFEPISSVNTTNLRRSSDSSHGDNIDTELQQPSIGGKLMNFAGRAFGGGQQPTPNTSFRKLASVGTTQISKSYSEDFRETTCMHLALMKISTPSAVIRKLPLPLLLLAVVAEANMYRFSIIEECVAIHFCDLVAKSPEEEVRSFAMEVLIRFMPSSLSKSDIGRKFGNRPVMIPDGESIDDSPLGVAPIDSVEGYKVNDESEKQLSSDGGPENELQVLKILCRTIQRTDQVGTAETGLKALHVVLEGSVHSLSGGDLVTIVRTLSLLSGYNGSQNNEATSIDRSSKSWTNVSAHSFQTFKLIFDEYLESLPDSSETASTETRVAMIDCCVAFGRSHHDVNTALTATGMLWSLADRDSSSETLDAVLSNLALLSSDNRPELRNCSVNTLFSCVVGLGERFTENQWKKSLNDTIFGVMREIALGISGAKDTGVAEDATIKDRYKVAVHHTRNSSSKQWAATQVLALRGLERVLRQYFTRLLATATSTSPSSGDSQQPWLITTWGEILAFSLDCSKLVGGREALDVRMAGVELIVLCAQLSCKAGIVAAGTTARVGTNMEVVGGALRSVRAATKDKKNEITAPTLPLDNALRQQLFELAFTTIDEFRQYLEENGTTNSDDYSGVDSLLTQVLTKIMGELAKLYECCKNDEMSPGACALQLNIAIENDEGYESRFLYLLQVIANNADDGSSSRYLNQVQKGVMSLLQNMASNSSLRAFKALATTSGDYMFVQSNENGGESFELEAAKTVASAFDSDNLSDEAKVTVMCSVLSHYLKIYGSDKEVIPSDAAERNTSQARYDIVTKVIDSGCHAAANIDVATDDKTILDSIWERIVTVVTSLILPPAASRYDGYAHHSKSILDIVAIVLTHLPPRKYALAEPMLEQGANRAVEVAFECIEDVDKPDAAEGAVHVFLACFMGLCQKMPSCSAVTSLTNHILGEAIDSNVEDDSVLFSKTQQSLAIAVCESLQTTTSQDLLVGVFPLLCRLTNVENDGLRRVAGRILCGVNLSQAISRERQRAQEADIRAQEVEEENSAMLEEIEYLQAENDELQRQLALFTTEADA